LSIRIERGQLTGDQWAEIQQGIQAVLDHEAVKIIPSHRYVHLQAVARRRIPRDPNDWPTVALAITLDAGILTNDYDFLGCGGPTWTMETLRGELEDR
jgi:predicted nucleic acid-binding protein